MTFLSEPKKGTKWPKKLPQFGSRQEAVAVCKELVKATFLLRSEKRGKGELAVCISERINPNGSACYYYQHSLTHVCCFPCCFFPVITDAPNNPGFAISRIR